MCRLFVFKGNKFNSLNKKLLHDENSLLALSSEHPDGWGIAYYLGSFPGVIKSPLCAKKDFLFRQTCDQIQAHLIIAHIRRATIGSKTPVNTHPFQYGPWIFAHNGNIKNFPSIKQKLLALVDKELRPFILGSTDSELCFFLILSLLKKKTPQLLSPKIRAQTLAECIFQFVEIITHYAGPLAKTAEELKKGNCLTCILTNGERILAFNGGKALYYTKESHGKQLAGSSERGTMIASVPTEPREQWQLIPPNELLIISKNNTSSMWQYI